MKLYQMGFGAERNSSFSALREALIELTRKFTPEASRYAASNKISKATELLNHGLRERAKARTEMKMAGIDAHNRMLENKPITIERAGTSYS